MPKQSAGLLLYRRGEAGLEVLLAHPGGPLWARKDLGAWSIPKGEFLEDEAPLAAARREFAEEIGTRVEGEALALTPLKQPSRKVIHAFAVEQNLDVERITSNLFEMEWPPKSGRTQAFAEVDRAAWFGLGEARKRIQPGQVPILDELARRLGDAVR
ncbi:NUDIX domain-containing protein [Dongia sp.]|uniref:NUDIX domain-containing protein n=1 Tax=Dongia sp. TaxID=1977262 RepID=UPI00375189B4